MTPQTRRTLSWALYDWGNSAFATTVMAGFFPLFFKQYWNAAADVTLSTFRLGLANSVASLVIVALAPALGAIADAGGVKKRFLLFFAAMGIVMTGALYFVAAGQWAAAIALYVLGLIGFSGGNIFYDALLPDVATDERLHFVSGLGFALGYLGGGVLFACNVAMTQWPQAFGLADASEAVRWSFVSVAVWWAVFSIPVLLFVDEPAGARAPARAGIVRAGFRQLALTFRHVRQLRTVFLFLAGYWLYIDGVDTIIRMAVDYGLSLGFDGNSLVVALLITQFVGFPCALAFGKLGERIGAKSGIFIGLAVYVLVTLWGYFMDSVEEFYALAVAIGLVQGGVQSLSRSLYAQIIPQDKAAEFFGFYNMLGKFAAVVGPALMGWVGLVSGEPRMGIAAIVVLFVAGGLLLALVDPEEGARRAKAFDAG